MADPGSTSTDTPDESGVGTAPIATQQQEAIVADSGLGEQQPINSTTGNPDQVLVNVSSPQAQRGVPLNEDVAAGVEANPEVAGMVAPDAPEVAQTPEQTPAEQTNPEQPTEISGEPSAEAGA